MHDTGEVFYSPSSLTKEKDRKRVACEYRLAYHTLDLCAQILPWRMGLSVAL